MWRNVFSYYEVGRSGKYTMGASGYAGRGLYGNVGGLATLIGVTVNKILYESLGERDHRIKQHTFKNAEFHQSKLNYMKLGRLPS